MRTPMNRAARTYLRRVSRLMCCSGEEKRTRLQGLRESILEASAAGQPFETPDQVAAHFGAPEPSSSSSRARSAFNSFSFSLRSASSACWECPITADKFYLAVFQWNIYVVS